MVSSPDTAKRRKRTENKPSDKFSAYREARQNKSRLQDYQVKDEGDVYDVIEEGDYQMLARDRQKEEFIEDDDHAGYADGDEDWDEQHRFSDEYSDGEPRPTADRKRKRSKKDQQPVTKPKNQLDHFFKKTAERNAIAEKKPSSKKPVEVNEEFLENLLGELDEEPVAHNENSHQHNHQPSIPIPTKRGLHPNTLQSRNPLRQAEVPQVKEESPEPVDDFNFDEVDMESPLPSTNEDVVSETAEDEPKVKQEIPTTDHVEDDAMDEDESSFLKIKPVQTKARDVNGNLVNVTSKREIIRASLKTPAAPPIPAPAVPAPAAPTNNNLQSWEKVNMSETQVAEDTSANAAPDKLNVLEEDGSLRMWWFDAYERREKGQVYLFGKALNKATNTYVSCCVTVRNVQRNIFVLPRPYKLDKSGKPTDEKVDIAEVHDELDKVRTRARITKWACKPVERKYAFEEPNVPQEGEYLKIKYGFEQPALPTNLSGDTFSHVFGSTTNPLELLLIKRDIMGPCWLEVKNPNIASANETWCKVQAVIEDPKLCNPLKDANGNAPKDIPPLVVMSLSLRTVMNHQKHVNEIVAASAMVCKKVMVDEPTPVEKQEKVKFNVVRQLNGVPYPAGLSDLINKERKKGNTIHVEKTELALLNLLIAKLHVHDPDVIVGHNFAGFDLDILLHRMKALNTHHWHKLGRLKRSNWPKLQAGAGGSGESTFQERMIMSGRLICDTYLAAKDLIRSKSYRMTELAQSQLKIAREDIEFDKFASYYTSANSLVHLIKHCEFDSFLALALMFKLQVLPLTKQLTNLAGNLWSRTMTGARAERNEYLLLHEFHKNKYICPDKSFGPKPSAVIDAVEHDDDDGEQIVPKKASGRRKPAYLGGLVLEPKKGFYDKYVLLLDFNSLYPSIIQEYNICFTTVQRDASMSDSASGDIEAQIPEVPDKALAQGVLPRLIKALVDRRRQVKKLMKDPKLSEAESMQLDIRQQGLKLTANSMYGCLGFAHSRFYAKPLAMLITSKGREILQNTVDLASAQDLNVIYGDTDSIMVYTNESDISKVKEIGYELKKKVNERYNLLEIDLDGFFKHMLLLKKKKYAALLVEERDGKLIESVETKGLDLVRRDWCDLSHDVSSDVLDSILSSKDRDQVIDDIHNKLRAVGELIRNNGYSLDKFVINKQLTKAPQDYADAKSQPHVQVALRLKKTGVNVKAGDTIPYVICEAEGVANGSSAGFAERAFHPDDIKRGDKGLKIDFDWYLNQQIHPPVARLCAPMEGTDVARIAECLGLDTSKFHISVAAEQAEQEELYTLDSQINDEERFKDVEKLNVRCRGCQQRFDIAGVARIEGDRMVSGLECPNGLCKEVMMLHCLRTQLEVAIRAYIKRYYDGWLVCDDTSCGNRTRMMSVFGRRCLNQGCRGYMTAEYSDKMLYTQLLYLSSIFDTDKAKTSAENTPRALDVAELSNRYITQFAELKNTVNQYLERSGRRYVDLTQLFSFCTI
ncbi:hypothetical protein NQZ79_g4309 [Umbelopsis isabellina]|nr:hypothetical protein NQZ79_g4309 [Umbelopsis isabellina]